MKPESNLDPVLDADPVVDLRRYDQSWFDRGKPVWYILLWWLVQAIAFPLSPHNLNGFRCWLLRLFGAKIGINVLIRPTARFTYPWKVEIDDYSWIGDDVVFYSLDRISIGAHGQSRFSRYRLWLKNGSYCYRQRRVDSLRLLYSSRS
jgi:putative colanic acid biosynthesis acetyltransferase WcaF